MKRKNKSPFNQLLNLLNGFLWLLVAPVCFAAPLPSSELEHARNELESMDPVFNAPWYQVEIILFTHNNPDTTEQWDPEARLRSYPADFLIIDHPLAEDFALLEDKDRQGKKQLEEKYANLLESAWFDPGQLFGAYLPLPHEQWLLASLARNMNGRPQYTVLYHESWIQPLLEKEASMPLLIQAGEAFGDYYQLEGSLLLSVSRYIHLVPDLWLRQFSAYQPLREYAIDPIKGTVYSEHKSTADIPVPSEELQNSGEKAEAYTWSKKPLFIKEEGTYFIENQVHINEPRRMKSEELHYLDHPLFGILIKLVPYEHPELVRKEMLEELLESSGETEFSQ